MTLETWIGASWVTMPPVLLDAVDALYEDLVILWESLNNLALGTLVGARDDQNHIALVDLHT